MSIEDFHENRTNTTKRELSMRRHIHGNTHETTTDKKGYKYFFSKKNSIVLTDWLPLKGEQYLLLEGLLVPDGEVPEGGLKVQHQFFHASTYTVLYFYGIA